MAKRYHCKICGRDVIAPSINEALKKFKLTVNRNITSINIPQINYEQLEEL